MTAKLKLMNNDFLGKLQFLLSLIVKNKKLNVFYNLHKETPDYTGLLDWSRKGYSVPCPQFVKEKVFKKFNLSNSTWIETGTFHGTSTAYLASIATNVITLEPVVDLYEDARVKLGNLKNITFINKSSEDGIEEAINSISDNTNVCFWLDGHYSEGNTFLGEKHSPIEFELEVIEKHLKRFNNVSVLVDDFRLFQVYESDKIYPNKFFLVDFAKKNKLDFEIESDILILKK